MSPLSISITSSLGSMWNSLRPGRPRATKATLSGACQRMRTGLTLRRMPSVTSCRLTASIALITDPPAGVCAVAQPYYTSLRLGAEELGAHQRRALSERRQLGLGHGGRQVAQAAVGVEPQPLGRHYLQAPPDERRHLLRRLHARVLDIDHPHAQPERDSVLAEQRQVVGALAGELQQQHVDARVENTREQEVVAALPGGLAVAVAVADVQGDLGLDAVDQRVEHVHHPVQILG